MAQKVSADGDDEQMEEEKKQEEYQTIPGEIPEKEADVNTPSSSESPDGTNSLGASEGGPPKPEDESKSPICLEENQNSESEHLITCAFSISLAVPLTPPSK